MFSTVPDGTPPWFAVSSRISGNPPKIGAFLCELFRGSRPEAPVPADEARDPAVWSARCRLCRRAVEYAFESSLR